MLIQLGIFVEVNRTCQRKLYY